ncbi:MAG: NADH-quinone oxidoreductase subunit D-related protein, partial [Kineosporiaceae bacterium]
MSDPTLDPWAVDDPRQRPASGAADPKDAEDVDHPATVRIPGTTDDADPYGLSDDTPAEGRIFTASGGDWDEIAEEVAELGDERIVVNMGPQHPSTHGVLRLILELDGETVTEARCGIGYLHTGIEKSMEYRTWTQGVTLCTRMDYLTPLFQEVAYCRGVEKLLGIEDQIPERVDVIRVLLMELNRVSSHIVALATGGLEIGALTVMTVGFRMRERILKILELITGLRMNHGFVRPGGLAQDLPPGALDMITDTLPDVYQDVSDVEKLSNENPVVRSRLVDVGYLDLSGCMALGMTGPVLRATGLPHDLRRSQPYCGYEDYEFDVVTWDTCDAYGR